jgi:hypothetical protein
MSIWTWLWIAWGVAFFAIEIPAWLRSRTGTLSDTIRGWARVRGGQWTWRRWALLAFLVWLLGHLAFGWGPN